MLDTNSINFSKAVKVAVENLDYLSKNHDKRLVTLEEQVKVKATANEYTELQQRVTMLEAKRPELTESSRSGIRELEGKVTKLRETVEYLLNGCPAPVKTIYCPQDWVTQPTHTTQTQADYKVAFDRGYAEGYEAGKKVHATAPKVLEEKNEKLVAQNAENQRLLALIRRAHRYIEEYVCSCDSGADGPSELAGKDLSIALADKLPELKNKKLPGIYTTEYQGTFHTPTHSPWFVAEPELDVEVTVNCLGDRPLTQVLQGMSKLNPSKITVDCGGTGKYLHDELRSAGYPVVAKQKRAK